MQRRDIIPEQLQRRIRVDLGHVPLDHDAGVNDQGDGGVSGDTPALIAHGPQPDAALSAWGRSPRAARTRSARARYSDREGRSGAGPAARSRMNFNSACKDRPLPRRGP